MAVGEISLVELEIPVPWGHIAAKAWGNEKDEAILAVHGFLDNAASFDQLISLIMPGYYIICIDLPGHGRSSPYPDGVQLTYLSYVCDLKRVFNHFSWTKCSILCHSLGSHAAIYFSSIFNESVNKLIILDLFIGQLIPIDFISDRCADYVEKLLALENSLSKRQVYSYDEAFCKFFENRYYSMPEKSAYELLKRSLARNNHGYTFTNDKRLQFLKYPLITKEFHFALLKAIKCRTCIILSTDFEQFFNVPNTYNTFEILKTSLKNNLEFHKIEGNHYVHLNEPKSVANVINKSLMNVSSRL